ncbi:DUF805 domain-containing protein [Novosphingobium album (ex Liu et al. 2023)]|uniref:DUF805 domain-containing protein n=1 Tax=Novosphingobium album (ex Liu et al. 2023) TaxID=3031130 RepID=A0ABT5WMG2_9SPHN|nr:DUF805 domain-containing protein [Novosphingobium album (ex Liu et al. 2023)]MDE8650876.1 DUF805 domain-containing protein [Novosphingobium album (ex Liu et al. 2023)]
MIEWMLMPLRRYADFDGRSRRLEYWSFTLLNFVIAILLLVAMFAMGTSLGVFADIEAGNMSALFGWFLGGFGLVFVIWWLAFLIPNIAVSVRRLHDRNMSGWWYLGFIAINLIPIVNLLSPIAGIAFLVLMLLPGTPGPNQYGPDPKDPTGADVFL